MDKFEEMLGQQLDVMYNEEMEIRERERESYNQALEDFAKAIAEYKPQDEEYRNFQDVVNEVKNQLIK